MVNDPACSLCGSRDWRQRAPVSFTPSMVCTGSASRRQYLALRLRVLFEVWAVNAARVEFTPRWCSACGFVCFAPRPDAADMKAKYEFLGRHEQTGAALGPTAQEIEFDAMRAQRAFKLLTARAPGARTILDIGGGDGRLLEPFRQAAMECSVLDHNLQPVAGVSRVGASWDDIDPDARFDLLLCNHVLEHVCDPVGFAASALQHLAPGGVAYFEIPLEIWGGIPIDQDVVTHINFFHRRTLCHALRMAGYDVLGSRTIGGTYGPWRLPVCWALATRARTTSGVSTDPAGAALTRRLMDRPWLTRVSRRLWLEPQLDGSLARMARRFHGTRM